MTSSAERCLEHECARSFPERRHRLHVAYAPQRTTDPYHSSPDRRTRRTVSDVACRDGERLGILPRTERAASAYPLFREACERYGRAHERYRVSCELPSRDYR